MSIILGSNFKLNAQLPLRSGDTVANTTARDAIAAIERYEGRIIFVIADGKNYQLVGGITNSDWVEVGGSATPGGAVGSIQYNNSGALGGIGQIIDNTTNITIKPNDLTGEQAGNRGIDLILQSGLSSSDGGLGGQGGNVYIKAQHYRSDVGYYWNGSDIFLVHDYISGSNPNPPPFNRDGRIYISSLASPTGPSIQISNTTISGYADGSVGSNNYEYGLRLESASAVIGSNRSGKDLDLVIGEKDGAGPTNGVIKLMSSGRTTGDWTGANISVDRNNKYVTFYGNTSFDTDGTSLAFNASHGSDSGATSRRGGSLWFMVGKGDNGGDNGAIYYGTNDDSTETAVIRLVLDETGSQGPEAMFQGWTPSTNRAGYMIGLVANQGYDSGVNPQDGGSLLLGSGGGINGGNDGVIQFIHQITDNSTPIFGLRLDYTQADSLLGIIPTSQEMFSGRDNRNGLNVGIAGGNGEIADLVTEVLTNGDFENWTGAVIDDWTFNPGDSDHTYSKNLISPPHGLASITINLDYGTGTKEAVLYQIISGLSVGTTFSLQKIYARYDIGTPTVKLVYLDDANAGTPKIWHFSGINAGTWQTLAGAPTDSATSIDLSSYITGIWGPGIDLNVVIGSNIPTIPTGGKITPMIWVYGVSTDSVSLDYFRMEQTVVNGGTGGTGGNITISSGDAAGTGNNISGDVLIKTGGPTGTANKGRIAFVTDSTVGTSGMGTYIDWRINNDASALIKAADLLVSWQSASAGAESTSIELTRRSGGTDISVLDISNNGIFWNIQDDAANALLIKNGSKNYFRVQSSPGLESVYLLDTQINDCNQYVTEYQFINLEDLYYWWLDAGTAQGAGTYTGTKYGAKDLTVTGSIALETDVIGNSSAIDFDGVNDYLESTDAVFLTNDSFSVGAWVKRADWTENDIETIMSCCTTDGWKLQYNNGQITAIGLNSGTVWEIKMDCYQFDPDKWYHVALARDNTNKSQKIFVNAEEMPITSYTTTGNSSNPAGTFKVGSDVSGTNLWDGQIQMPAIQFGYVWDENTVQEIYSRSAGFFNVERVSDSVINFVGKEDNSIRSGVGRTMASTASLYLSMGSVTPISGTATINQISTNGCIAGTIYMLYFTGAAELKHNHTADAGFGNMQLAGSVNMTAANGAKIGFVFDGTSFQEAFRTFP